MKKGIKTIYLNLRRFFLYPLYLLFLVINLVRKQPEEKINTILFIRIDRIGDIVLSTPAIEALKRSYPDTKLIVLASKSNHAILKNNPFVNEIIIYDYRRSLFQILKNIRQLRDHKIDLAIDPHADYEIKTALFALLSGARKRIGFSDYGREYFFNHHASKNIREKHFVDLTSDVLKLLNIEVKNKSPKIYIAEKEHKWSESWVKKKLNNSMPILGIHPGAYYESQRWPEEHFAELISNLQKDNKMEIIIFGGPDDEILVERICSLTFKRPCTFISSDIRQFIAILACCHNLICNNSGPLHIAVAVNVPTISFMGPTSKERWMPLGNDHRVLRLDHLKCIGCNSGFCKIETHDCMRLISPEMVYTLIEDSMSKQIIYKQDYTNRLKITPVMAELADNRICK
jgi:heptosyltransferase-2